MQTRMFRDVEQVVVDGSGHVEGCCARVGCATQCFRGPQDPVNCNAVRAGGSTVVLCRSLCFGGVAVWIMDGVDSRGWIPQLLYMYCMCLEKGDPKEREVMLVLNQEHGLPSCSGKRSAGHATD